MTRSANSIEDVDSPSPTQPRLLVLPLIVTVFAAILGSVLLLGAAMYYMVKSGRLTLPGQGGALSLQRSEGALESATHTVVLEPLVVNLADEGGRAYLRLGLTLRIADPNVIKGTSSKEEGSQGAKGSSDGEASIRDAVLQVLGSRTSTALLESDGKLKLKADLKAAMVEQHPEILLRDVFFTEFLVQR